MARRINVSLLFICILVTFAGSDLKAASTTAVLDSGSIQEQFEYIIYKSSLYSDYRAVRNSWLYNLKSHVLDSLNNLKTELTSAESLNNQYKNQTDSLMTALASSQKAYQKSVQEKNSIGFLGIQMSKFTYNTLMWFIVGSLTILVLSLFFTFKRNHAVTKQLKQDFTEIQEEYESHRKRAREREEKMARQHLDEILKYKNKTGSLRIPGN